MSKTIYEIKKGLIAHIAVQLKSYGYRVYLAASGPYGFYTDGKRVVSFQESYLAVNFSGNYNSRNSGTGWGIESGEGLVDIDAATAERFIAMVAPRWAATESVTYTTPEQHLKTYGDSSRYVEFTDAQGDTHA